MDYTNQFQGAPADGAGNAQSRNGDPTAQTAGQYAPYPGQQPGAQQQSQQSQQPQQGTPQAGGYYQFQPGVGFVPVQGAAQGIQGPAQEAPQQPDAQYTGQSYQQQPGAQQYPGGQQGAYTQSGMYGPGTPEGATPKFDQNKLGQMYGVMRDVMNGEADPSKVLGLLPTNGADFWKGALVGAAVVVLLNNDSVKNAMAGAVGAMGSMFGEKDPEGPQVTLD